MKQYTFQKFAEKYVSQKEMDYILNSCGYSGQLKHMNMYDAKRLFGEGIRNDVKFWLGKFQLLVNKMIEYLKDKHANIRLGLMLKVFNIIPIMMHIKSYTMIFLYMQEKLFFVCQKKHY